MKSTLAASLIIIALVSGCVENVQVNTTINRSEIPPVVDIAKNDLAKKLNISAGEIQIIKLEKVDWPDTSLGYPEKRKMYAQVITPGFRIVLKAGDRSYEYHSDYTRVAGPREV